MKVALLCIVLLFTSAIFAEEAVITLTTDNFDEVVNNADFIVVEFYAPWCGHCKHLAPEYEKAAQILKTRNPPIPLAKVDATVETELGNRFAITGYPTLKIFRNGIDSEYNGPRQADGIVSYIEKQAGPASKVLSSDEDIQSFKTRGDVVIIAFNSDSAALDEYRAAANRLRDEFLFAEVTDKALVDASGHAGKVVVFRSDEKEFEVEGDIATFIRTHALPIAGEFTNDNAKLYMDSGLPTLKVYIDVDWTVNQKRTLYYKRRLLKVGQEFEGKMNFALANKASQLHDPQAFGINGPAPEFVVAIEDKSLRKYLYPYKTFSVENIRQFATDFLAGKLKPFLKSEPVPESNDGPVKVVVGTTFEDIVMDPTKNVFIEFYAPWCGHCKSLAPKYEELGKKFEDKADIVIAKIDATANDWPKDLFQVTGYPTIYFKPAGSNGDDIIQYQGAREVKAMSSFIKNNAVKQKKTKDEL